MFFGAGCEYRYLRSCHRFAGSRAYDASPGRRRRRTLLCFERDRRHQSEQQILLYQLESLMKGSSYYVFLCVVEFMHEKFPRVKTECNRVHEAFDRAAQTLVPVRHMSTRRTYRSVEPLLFTYL